MSWFARMMKWPKRLLLLLWLLLMMTVGGVIYTENKAAIDVSIFSYKIEDLSVGALICVMLFIGAIIGFSTAFISAQLKVSGHKRRAKKAEKEVARIKASSSQMSPIERVVNEKGSTPAH